MYMEILKVQAKQLIAKKKDKVKGNGRTVS